MCSGKFDSTRSETPMASTNHHHRRRQKRSRIPSASISNTSSTNNATPTTVRTLHNNNNNNSNYYSDISSLLLRLQCFCLKFQVQTLLLCVTLVGVITNTHIHRQLGSSSLLSATTTTTTTDGGDSNTISGETLSGLSPQVAQEHYYLRRSMRDIVVASEESSELPSFPSLVAADELQHVAAAAADYNDSDSTTTMWYWLFLRLLVLMVLVGWACWKINKRNRFFSVCYDMLSVPSKVKKSLRVRNFKKPRKSDPSLRQWKGPTAQFPPGTKIIWGHWNTGEANMLPFAKLCVKSWRVRNPNAQIIILSNDNYRQYTSPEDLPSTFDDLLPQHQSDILRMAVLIRYGGIYMDVTTMLFKSLEAIFDDMPTNTLGVAPMYSWKDKATTTTYFDEETGSTSRASKERILYNNYILIAPQPKNSALMEWRHRCRAYMEDPATSLDELDSKPLLQRVRPFMTCPEIGMMKIQAPYLALCWLLTDLAWHEKDLNIMELPFAEFGLATPVLHEYTKQWKALPKETRAKYESLSTKAQQDSPRSLIASNKVFTPAPTPSSQPITYILGMAWTMLNLARVLNPTLIQLCAQNFTLLKVSVHFHDMDGVENPSGVHYLQESISSLSMLPLSQATLERSQLCRDKFKL